MWVGRTLTAQIGELQVKILELTGHNESLRATLTKTNEADPAVLEPAVSSADINQLQTTIGELQAKILELTGQNESLRATLTKTNEAETAVLEPPAVEYDTWVTSMLQKIEELTDDNAKLRLGHQTRK